MRQSEIYFALAVMFALYLTWRVTSAVRKTMKRTSETDELERE
ncbi:hypothetical protein [Alicyclobacillus fastidiosus]|uniref:CcmD family protein n=1 Tax=Alicyclobacillus fastidiosus TaxID=392011 RepID=A0ABV5ADX9_9BACL|nr:hypothetical protein [Alicyclobacillus fastidiosus]WEH11248.1 hypothetical protein PYS47_08550 [Alicyclobacillus fastidiosus]